MTRAELESTATIRRDALLGLLELTRADEVAATKSTHRSSRPKRTRARTFSQMAALLGPCEPHATRPPPLGYPKPRPCPLVDQPVDEPKPEPAAAEPPTPPEVTQIRVTTQVTAQQSAHNRLRWFATIIASVAATFLAGLCAGYFFG